MPFETASIFSDKVRMRFVFPLGTTDDNVWGVLTDEQVFAITASLAHETVRKYCHATGQVPSAIWNELDANTRKATVDGVKFTYENHTTASLEDQHNNWMTARIADGWVHGEIKDNEKKTHPMLVPYDALPENNKIKNVLFRAIVLSLLLD